MAVSALKFQNDFLARRVSRSYFTHNFLLIFLANLSSRFVFLLRQKGPGILCVEEDATLSSLEYLIFAKKVASRRRLDRTAGR